MMKEWFDEIIDACQSLANPEKAIGMKAYMKNQFEFLGISSPERKELVSSFRKDKKISPDDRFWQLIEKLWKSPFRECQYIAIDLMTPLAKKMDCSNVPILEQLILTKSWWDTVDGLAPNIAGAIFKKDINCRNNYVYRWMESKNIWLQRSSVIFQLKYKKETDWDMLCEAILKHDTSSEFFVRKAQGWALRNYSSIQPQAVISFVEANPQLSGLTKKEALRKIIV